MSDEEFDLENIDLYPEEDDDTPAPDPLAEDDEEEDGWIDPDMDDEPLDIPLEDELDEGDEE